MKLTLRAARVNKGYSIDKASDLLNVSSYTLRNYEVGKTIPRIDFLLCAAKIYDCPYDNMDFSCFENSLKED